MRRTAAGVLASALALSGAVAVATPASAGPNFALERIAGNDRYETSARIAEAFGPTTGAILASGETGRSVDALSANFLAGVQGVPVLLTQRDRVPASVMARLNALTGAKNVTIVGGTVAVSAAVETQLRGMGFTVTRLGGEDRYATSEAIITAGRAQANPIGLVASGLSFPDALAGAPLSYKGKHPVFLTSGQSIPQDTIDAMVAAGTRQVIILGGTAAVPASVEAALVARGISVVTRLGGAGRSETSRIVADYLINNQGFTNTTFNLASGAPRSEGVDALSGGALSGKQNRALLITDTQTQAAPVIAFARDRAATLNATGNIFGGPAAVAVALEEAIEAAGRTSPGPVAVTSASVAQGGNLTGTITGDFSSVTVTGCGFTNQTVGPDSDTTAAGRQFSLTVPAGQAPGACNVVFTFTPTGGGATTTQTVAVTVTAANFQTLNVTPQDAVTLELADEASTTAATRNADNRTYTVTGLTDATRYRITLVNASSIQGTGAGRTFLSSAVEGSTTSFAVNTGADIADIVSVNGAAPTFGTGDTEMRSATANPVAGNITFTIDGTAPGTVVPLVYIDGGQGGTATTGGTSNRLETSATAAGQFAAVSETFGAGGPTTFVPPQAQSGFVAGNATGNTATTTTRATGVDKTANTFTTGTGAATVRFNYDANDQFTLNGVSVGIDAFEAALSSGDLVSGNFTRDVAGISQFALTDENPPAVAATAVVGTGASSRNVTVTASFTGDVGDVDQVVIQRAPVTGTTPAAESAFVTVTTVTATDVDANAAGTQISFVDVNVAVGSYQYRVAGINDGDQGPFGAASAIVTTTAPAADTVGPRSADARVSTDSGFAGVADAGDVFTISFDEQLAAPAAGASLRLTDADGTVLDVVNGANATFALNTTAATFLNGGARAVGTVLTVTLQGAQTATTAGTTAGLQYASATITNSANVNDVAGNRFDVAGSGDVALNVAANVTTAPTAPPSSPQNLNSAVAAANTNNLTVTYQNPVTCASVVTGDFTFTLTGGGTITPTSVECTGTTDNTLVFTFPGSAFIDETGTVAATADAVTDANNAPQPADSVGFTTQ